jgi:hypothetical protein
MSRKGFRKYMPGANSLFGKVVGIMTCFFSGGVLLQDINSTIKSEGREKCLVSLFFIIQY